MRPPRLGGRERVGVFASRAPYRPNPIGLSAVEHLGLERGPAGLTLRLRGVDLLDGTPVLDVKPYVPYADAMPRGTLRVRGRADARGSGRWPSARRPSQASRAPTRTARRELRLLIAQVLAQDPRPGYMDRYPEREQFALRLYDLELRWRVQGRTALVVGVEPVAGTASGTAPG